MNKSIRYLAALVCSIGFTVGSQLMELPVAYLAAGIIASVLIVILFVGNIVRG